MAEYEYRIYILDKSECSVLIAAAAHIRVNNIKYVCT